MNFKSRYINKGRIPAAAYGLGAGSALGGVSHVGTTAGKIEFAAGALIFVGTAAASRIHKLKRPDSQTQQQITLKQLMKGIAHSFRGDFERPQVRTLIDLAREYEAEGNPEKAIASMHFAARKLYLSRKLFNREAEEIAQRHSYLSQRKMAEGYMGFESDWRRD